MKKLLLLSLFFLLLTSCANVSQYQAISDGYQEYAEDNGFLADALTITDKYEAIHPVFLREDIHEDYTQKKMEYLEQIGPNITFDEFYFLTLEYLMVFRDAHATYEPDEGDIKSLPYNFTINEDNLYLDDKEVSLIAGITPERLFDLVDKYIYYENESTKTYARYNYAFTDLFLYRAGGSFDEEGVSVELTDGTTAILCFVQGHYNSAYRVSSSMSAEMIEDTLLITLNRMTYDDDFKAFNEGIKEYANNGIQKVVIDLRQSPGGNALVGQAILNSLGMIPPNYGAFYRYSEELIEELPDLETPLYPIRKTRRVDPSVEVATGNPSMDLKVLTSANTFSAATWLATWVQDGNLGEVIGEISGNSPNSYGDVVSIPLEHVGGNINISYAYHSRPDINANEESLIPDVEVPSQEALERALESF